MDSWVSQQLVRFASTDYGDSVVAADDLLKAMEESYLPALKKNKHVRFCLCAQRLVRGCSVGGVPAAEYDALGLLLPPPSPRASY